MRNEREVGTVLQFIKASVNSVLECIQGRGTNNRAGETVSDVGNTQTEKVLSSIQPKRLLLELVLVSSCDCVCVTREEAIMGHVVEAVAVFVGLNEIPTKSPESQAWQFQCFEPVLVFQVH